MKNRNFKWLILLCLVTLANLVPSLGCLCPPAAGITITAVSTAYSALAFVAGAAGPVGWSILGMCAVWSF